MSRRKYPHTIPRALTMLSWGLGLVGAAGHAWSGTGCNLVSGGCPSKVVACSGGTLSVSVWDATASGDCGKGGSMDLRGTQYEFSCSKGPCGTIKTPPLRYWEYDDYMEANSGCQSLQDGPWFGNAAYDWTWNPGVNPVPGHWLLDASWFGPDLDGHPIKRQRTVAEISAPFLAKEGTCDHYAWYAIGSVLRIGTYNFDGIRGTGVPGRNPGCGPANIPTLAVPGLLIANRSAACTCGSVESVGRVNAANAGMFDIDVQFLNPTPVYFTENGVGDPSTQLIEGFEVLYAQGSEPTTSSYDPFKALNDPARVWYPVRDPANPTALLGVIPWGTRDATVTIPAGGQRWLATRLVYTDCSVNGSKVLTASCPAVTVPTGDPLRLGSQLSSHCGPVRGPQ